MIITIYALKSKLKTIIHPDYISINKKNVKKDGPHAAVSFIRLNQ